jgi:uncharacterized protein YdaT
MNLKGIIAISGKTGLFKVVAQAKNSVIVESLIDNKRMPAHASDRISALEDISIYAFDKDAPLKDIFSSMFQKEGGKEVPSHKENIKILQSYILEILPNYDQERVYPSDLKKIFQWYNLLLKQGYLSLEEETLTEANNSDVLVQEVDKNTAEVKLKATNKAASKLKNTKSDSSAVAKQVTTKKTSTVKTGSSRGK